MAPEAVWLILACVAFVWKSLKNTKAVPLLLYHVDSRALRSALCSYWSTSGETLVMLRERRQKRVRTSWLDWRVLIKCLLFFSILLHPPEQTNKLLKTVAVAQQLLNCDKKKKTIHCDGLMFQVSAGGFSPWIWILKCDGESLNVGMIHAPLISWMAWTDWLILKVWGHVGYTQYIMKQMGQSQSMTSSREYRRRWFCEGSRG